MPPQSIHPTLLRMTWHWTLSGGRDAVNVTHWSLAHNAADGPPSVAKMGQLCQEVIVQLATSNGGNGIRPLFKPDTILTEVRVTTLGQDPPYEAAAQTATAGTKNSDSTTPRETAMVCTLRSPFVGKSHRGRIFLPAPAGTEVGADGTLDDGSRNLLQAVLTATLKPGEDNGYDLGDGWNADCVVYSRKLDRISPVSTIVVRDTLHHQSRRNG